MDHNDIINIVMGGKKDGAMSESTGGGIVDGNASFLEELQNAGGKPSVKQKVTNDDIYAMMVPPDKKTVVKESEEVVNDDYNLAPKTKFKFRTVNEPTKLKLRKRSWQ